jgi:aspartyl-tRNA(Asn)/glutamyl-tRNA(Gln) amidotransferase subunit B
MSNYKITIGCEVHTELKTKSKMFSNAPIIDNAAPNTTINEVDLALPGTMPSVNKQAVVFGIKLAKALDMFVEPNLIFDRKNYFYQDLPKGFQITQQNFPIGKDGKIQISENKFINVERIHLEEDTAKQNNINGEIYLDYNRAGVPLIEIVSKPDIHSKEECIKYLSEIKKTLTFLEISDGKMENGSLRVDLNISVADENSNVLGTKVEIKNMNSFANVAKAIDFEYNRQKELLDSNRLVEQETRR